LPIEPASEYAPVRSAIEPRLAMEMDFHARSHVAQRLTHFTRLQIVAAALLGLLPILPMLVWR
jgi:hypothetical protein